MAVPLDVCCVFHFLHQLGDISHPLLLSLHFTAGGATPLTLMMLLLVSLEVRITALPTGKEEETKQLFIIVVFKLSPCCGCNILSSG
jgi:hypothetical protein